MSAAPHSFPFHIGDYLRDTRGLSLAEHGAYLMLILEYYSSGKPLKADLPYIYKVAGAHSSFERKVVDRVLGRYFRNGHGLYQHSRIDAEIERYNDRVAEARKAARQKWDKASINQGEDFAQPYADAMPAQSARKASGIPAVDLKPLAVDLGVSGVVSNTPILKDSGTHTVAHSLARSAQAGGFDLFWSSYPKKRNKGDALKAWRDLKPAEALMRKIVAAIDAAMDGVEWQRKGGRFIPYPASWLRARGWEDERSPQAAEHGLTQEPQSKTGRGLVALERMKRGSG